MTISQLWTFKLNTVAKVKVVMYLLKENSCVWITLVEINSGG